MPSAMPVADDTVSIASSKTRRELDVPPLPAQEQLAVPDGKIEDTDDWEHNPSNPRNWSSSKKWTATSLVSIHLSFPVTSHSFLTGVLLHACHTSRQLHDGSWPPRPCLEIRYYKPCNPRADPQHLPSVLCHWTFILGSPLRDVRPYLGMPLVLLAPPTLDSH